jgi:DNA polymerase (family 10)
VAGSFRRKLETIGDLDFIVASPNAQKIMDWFTRQASVMMIQAKGPTKSSVRLKGGIQADLRVVPLEQFPYALLYFTGSKDFNISLRQRANHLGYTLNEYDLSPLEGTKKRRKACASEADIFQALKLEYIPPELREGYGEIEAAERGKLPVLVEEGDIRGIFHCHTTDSDGHNTLQEMAEEAQKLGWEYLGISDHSKASYQANGMDEERLFAQMQKIDTLNRSGKYSVHLFAGLECDILADGTLDFSDDILKELDFVIISAHRRYKQDEKTLTSRLIRAIENPYSTMVGHLTGRLLLHREPSPVNVPKVIDACIANHKIIELNAHPYRLDMDWRFWHQAAEKGAMCCINPDAHSTDELRYYVAGIQVARKGWLEKRHVLNTQSLLKIKKNLNNK